ncbi:MAG: hypothetical protein KGJ09_10875, partial [Candidatus Omnitrophica bacterium]|nr:hypothetical protein [Candidatus Omnitrophota bacterium]
MVSYNFVPKAAGNYTFYAAVTDTGTTAAYAFNSTKITVTTDNAIVFGSPAIIIPNSTIDIGQSENVVANVIGGTKPYTAYSWTENGNPVSDNSNTLYFTGTVLGANTVFVTVTDSAGQKATGHGSITVTYAKFSLGSGPQPAVQYEDQGQRATIIQNQTSGGAMPYGYSWYSSTNPSVQPTPTSLCASPHSNSCIFSTNNSTPIGRYYFEVHVNDSAGEHSNSSFATVIVSTAPASVLSAANQIGEIGQNDMLTVKTTGGVGPYTVNIIYANNRTVAATFPAVSYNGMVSYNFVPKAAGNYTFYAAVTDTGTTAAYAFNST